jgi:hypothetical protein
LRYKKNLPLLNSKSLQSTEISLTNELNVAQKEKNIDEWLILLKNNIVLMKSQLVTSYTGKYSYYGSIFIAFDIFPNHNYC